MTKSKVQEFYLTAKKMNEIRSESFFVFWSLFVSADKIVTLSRISTGSSDLSHQQHLVRREGFFFLPIIHAVNTTLNALVSAGF